MAGVIPSERDRHAQARPESFRDLTLDLSRERVRCFRCRCRFDPVDGLRESDNDTNCAVCDCRVSVGPLGLHKPLRSCPTRPWRGHIGSGLWCCYWSRSGWRTGSRPSRLTAVAAVLVWPLTTAAASLSPEEAPGHVRENATMCGIVASAHYAARSKGSFFGFAGMAQSAPPYLRRKESGWSS